MEPDKLHSSTATALVGELVLQNGKQAGTRRPLGTPTTFIGRNASCDIRLNVDGVDPLHCLLVSGPDGIVVRDLNSGDGTHVNGVRSEHLTLQHGDILKVGPFQFRLEMSAAPKADAVPETSDETREALRVQASAIAAQQIALEEEESRLEKRKAALRQQEEQLAAHLAEKQRQVQQWSEYTKTEREALRQEKFEHEKKVAKVEGEMVHAQQELEKDQQKLNLERQHINKVYQRLRQRWQKQWSVQKEKYRKWAEELDTQSKNLAETDNDLRRRETVLARESLAFHNDRELSMRHIQEGRDTLRKDQETWRKRRSLEFAALNARRRELEETQAKITQARQLLMKDKDAWTQQLNTLQAELHGVNNRINHQRIRIQENEEKLARLDTLRRDRQGPTAAETKPEASVPIEGAIQMPPDVARAAPAGDYQQRCADLERLAGELADQRALLVEQYKRLAEIQGAWQVERSHAAAELEVLAQRLAADEQALAERQQQASAAEELLLERQAEIDDVRQEILTWRAQLKAREQAFDEEHEHELIDLRQKETLLRDQLAGLAQLRQRWNQRRQEEIDQLQKNRGNLARAQKQTQAERVAIFTRGQKLTEEKRALAEKALALEQYRQEVFQRAKDPAAQRRVERLRRRWTSLNAALIGAAKDEREQTKIELERLEESRAKILDQLARLTQDESALAETHTLLDEREAALNARQMFLQQQISRLERQRNQADGDEALEAIEVVEVDEAPAAQEGADDNQKKAA